MEFKSVLARSFKIPWKISRVLKDYCEWGGDRKRLDRISKKDVDYLIASCNIGDNLRVSFALYLGFDVHASYDLALRWAAFYGYTDVCALLLNHGADVHAAYDYALRYAKKNGHKDVCKLLKKYMDK